MALSEWIVWRVNHHRQVRQNWVAAGSDWQSARDNFGLHTGGLPTGGLPTQGPGKLITDLNK